MFSWGHQHKALLFQTRGWRPDMASVCKDDLEPERLKISRGGHWLWVSTFLDAQRGTPSTRFPEAKITHGSH